MLAATKFQLGGCFHLFSVIPSPFLLLAAHNDHVMDQLPILADVAVDRLSRRDVFKDLKPVARSITELFLELAHSSDLRLPFPSNHRCRP